MGEGFHRSVQPVANPTAQLTPTRLPHGKVAEPAALNLPFDSYIHGNDVFGHSETALVIDGNLLSVRRKCTETFDDKPGRGTGNIVRGSASVDDPGERRSQPANPRREKIGIRRW